MVANGCAKSSGFAAFQCILVYFGELYASKCLDSGKTFGSETGFQGKAH